MDKSNIEEIYILERLYMDKKSDKDKTDLKPLIGQIGDLKDLGIEGLILSPLRKLEKSKKGKKKNTYSRMWKNLRRTFLNKGGFGHG